MIKKEILDLWDYDKNTLSPENLSPKSHKKVWIKCENGHNHSYQRTLSGLDRSNNIECLYCSDKKILKGFNDLATTYPKSTKCWDYIKNMITPHDVVKGSGKKVWWKCDKNHSYEKVIHLFVKSDNPCPYCNNVKLLSGFNDLQTTYPELTKMWDYRKNNIPPEKIICNSNKKFFWVCNKNHSYEKSIYQMKRTNNSCPICNNLEILEGYNDFANNYPELLKLWNYNKNTVLPTSVLSNSDYNAWWICEKGHEYQQKIKYKVNSKSIKCSICNKKGKPIVTKDNNLAKSNPALLKNWDYKRNTILPEKLSPNSSFKVWWICDKNHHYKQSVLNKKQGKKCPYCINRKIWKGYNDLATTDPEIIKYWDYEQNVYLPSEVSRGQNINIWWKCENGEKHSYKQTINNKIYKNATCVYCSNKKVLTGYNDLSTTHPEIIKFWDYKKNKILPTEVTYGTDMKIYWVCKKGHSFQRKPNSFIKAQTCPTCTPYGTSQTEKELYNYIKSILPENIKIIQNDKTVLNGLEIDIYLPDKNIAIEFNGLYWHTENMGKDKYYHYNKWKKCYDKNIQLITIWEDDWKNERKNSIIKNMISYKLGNYDGKKVYARNTVISYHESKNDEIVDFCNKNHIQGFVTGTYYISLKDKKDNIVALSIWRKTGDTLYLDRYCTNIQVVGGLGKLLKHVINISKENNIEKIVTFADRQVSNGNLYETLGFKKEKELKPDYCYLYNGTRHHKFGFRKKRFKNDPELLYQDNMTEKELADLNEIYRIWDCGKEKYTITIK